jgi:bifunctional DNA-binding transcriptional regulator/antitoxin component of YhaV-PrlF toxin-antitoxin module
MSEIKFRRKVIMSNRSLMVNIPIEIAEAMEIEKGDELEITYENKTFTCQKAKKRV